MRKRKWTKELVVEQLQAWHAAGVPTRELHRRDPPMTSMAAYLFGRWKLALAAAGIEPVRKKWTREKIVEELRRTRGQGLTVTDVLVAACRREFGTLRAACEIAGVRCLTKTPPHLKWDRETVVARIRRRHDEGVSLRAIVHEDPALYLAANRLFGNWTKAREAAGHPVPPKVAIPLDEVLQRIRTHASKGGSLSELQKSDAFLFQSAKRHFRSWVNACEAAGFETTRSRRWTKPKLIAAIQKRHAEGFELRHTWREDTSLFGSTVHHFGAWRIAMKAAGFEPIKAERWNKQRVIARLRAWHERSDHTNLKLSDEPLSAACYRLFGSHIAAMDAAGVEPKRLNPRDATRWTKE